MCDDNGHPSHECNAFVGINVKYSSMTFDEVVGISEYDNRPIAAFVSPGNFLVQYPSSSNQIRVSNKYIFNLDHLDYNIIPYMKYGSIALFVHSLFPHHDFSLNCHKSIKRLFFYMINYKTVNPNAVRHTVIINNNSLIIDHDFYDLNEKSICDIIPLNIIQDAINKTQQTNTIITDINVFMSNPKVPEFNPISQFFNILQH